jgi:hypothetical protein
VPPSITSISGSANLCGHRRSALQSNASTGLNPFSLQAKKAMSKNDAKAFNTFAQKLKKNNKDYQAEIDRFKQVQRHLPVSA